jgi:hypothetical protein
MQKMPRLTCRKCPCVNPLVYLAPVEIKPGEGTCVCLPCARAAGFLTPDGDLKPGYVL